MEFVLQNGMTAWVDDEDWRSLGLDSYTWQAKRHRGDKFYVVANVWRPELGRQAGVRMHRLIMGAGKGQEVDHIDGNRLNNRRSNLRLATNAENQQNTGSRKGSSRHKGVSWIAARGVWRVAFNWRGKTHFVGYFTDEAEAALAYNAAIQPLAGEFARLNTVDLGSESVVNGGKRQ